MKKKSMLNEIIELFKKAPDLKAKGLRSGYKKLLEYDGIVFAVKKFDDRIPEHEFEFVTWQRGFQGDMYYGNYFTDFERAKSDFAERSGLISRGRMFDESELLLIHSGLVKAGTFPDSDHATRKSIGQIVEKIEGLEIEALDEYLYETDKRMELDDTLELEQ